MMAAILQKVLTPIGKTLCSLHGCSILKLDETALAALGPAAMTLARAEGLEAHRTSVEIRLNG